MSCKFGVLAFLGMLSAAMSTQSKPPRDLQLTMSSWSAHSASEETVYVATRATNTGSEPFNVFGGVRFRAVYVPSAGSDSVLAVQQEAALKSNPGLLDSDGNRHVRCGFPDFPRLMNSERPSTGPWRILNPGEVLADTFALALPRYKFQAWPGEVVITCSLWVQKTGEDPYAPEDLRISIPVP
jgi:hypothetical protein